ncbi:POM121-like protein 2 [Ursus americanus]|uniref:POM121-like protein 2 n=1 Tax=Ursus arctos TaxID=9644 RepID=UPI001CF8FCED|nr:POM121-like protein 2 [Ursus arctos]XP_045661028.1 POM121-like protein 2 [Ursus americanus]XP_045661029.1 POM121-like protein 2 [Ursus americanus]XP_045661030.1 POM121-like protein 2 [Ursus americanus]XP_045661032.1 POM121-like protein 2 [Ursus americanus]XP_045661033.1 POM121-like protein 2 [Ursus americanus]
MGSYLSRSLGSAKAAPRRPAWRPRSPRSRPAYRPLGPVQSQVISIHRERWIRSRPHPTMPPHLDHPGVQRVIVPKAWRRFHGKSPLQTFLGLEFSSNRKSFVKQWHWKTQNLLNIWNMVTTKMTPPECSGSFSRGPPMQEHPDSCAKESRLRARSRCKKGKKRIHRPLQFEAPHAKRRRQSPGAKPSAFKPVWKDGVVPSFVPRPGPLRRGLCSWDPSDGEDTRPGPDLLPGHHQATAE